MSNKIIKKSIVTVFGDRKPDPQKEADALPGCGCSPEDKGLCAGIM
jgi:hypothetical protein